MDELSSARATAPAPIFATAKFCSSSGESAETKVSMACTRRALVPSWRAAASAPSSPISSRVLKRKITGCLSFVRSSRRSARISAAQPMRSSKERPGRAARQPRVARQEDARDVAATRVNQGRLRLEEREDEAAAVPQAERPVGVDRVDAKPDLVQVRDDHHGPIALPGSDPEVAGAVRLSSGPAWEQALNRGSYRSFHT